MFDRLAEHVIAPGETYRVEVNHRLSDILGPVASNPTDA